MNDRPHTASGNVQIIDTAFYIPTLNRTRRIWLYLPEEYKNSKKKYPVLYMHDGQNLFDESTSFSGEWKVDETMDELANACMVVGIDNGESKRMNEYNPNDTHQFGKGEGRQYLEFIVKTLKPYIDKKYRTLRSAKNTMMAGSSMGGLITFYAGLYYPKVFGKLGVLSPAFWVSPNIREEIRQAVRPSTHSTQKFFFYGGGAENLTMVSEIHQVNDAMNHNAQSKNAMLV
ncbi:MAG: alpha/beta hydrolase-fold protein, partial [Chitinophagaceae bacterium]